SAGCEVNAAPLAVGELGAVTKVSCVAAPAVPVAVKVTVAAPVADALSVFEPASWPRRHGICAVPVASLVTLAVVTKVPPLFTAPPPDATVKVTCTPCTGLPAASFTTTAGGVATVVLTVAD